FCQKHRMPAVAVTDRNNLFGALECSKLAKDSGVQPIIGATMQLVMPGGKSVGATGMPRPFAHLPLLAQNEEGYRNLLSLVSDSYMAPGTEPGPNMDLSMLHHRAEGLIAL